ncbi:hypothetical protein [Limnospira indica]|uniref:hypothetical protein n=1 Tax=Limnospira indica TaxID=147322 RepID=UPI00235464D0|nr:hypothetical protein [Limnospira indica]
MTCEPGGLRNPVSQTGFLGQQGVQQGQRSLLESMLQVKFGAVDAELAEIIDRLIAVPPLEQAQLIWQLSREELLARFSRDI